MKHNYSISKIVLLSVAIIILIRTCDYMFNNIHIEFSNYGAMHCYLRRHCFYHAIKLLYENGTTSFVVNIYRITDLV